MSEAKPAAAAAAPKKSKQLLLIIVAAVVVVGGGAGAWLFLKPGAKPDKDAAAKSGHEATAVKAAPQYFKFEPAFVVNFGEQGNTRFLQVGLEAMSRDAAVVEAVKASEPAIRNDLVLLYSSQKYDELLSADGKEKLRQSTLTTIRKIVAEEGVKPESLEGVYFTSFVIQ
jgi:flagellar FliL protein